MKPGLSLLRTNSMCGPSSASIGDVLDADDARPVAAEERAGDAARAPVGRDREPHQRLEIDRVAAARLADADVALAADHRHVHHVDRVELRRQQAR